MKRSLKGVLTVGGVLCAAVFAMIADVQLRYVNNIETFATSPLLVQKDGSRTAIILGASVKPNKTPSDALQDRLEEGIWLHETGFAGKLYVTGDDGAFHADEVSIMKNYLLSKGVPEGDILTDEKGYRTYESCKNAKEAGVAKAIVVTQRFHLGRALYLCNQLGIDTVGSPADRQSYQRIIFFWARDLAASVKAWWDINVWPPKPPV